MKRLVDVGINGNDTIKNSSFNIEKIGEVLEDNEYYYQEYKINSSIEMASYKIQNLNNFPEGTFIGNNQNVFQDEFYSNETFRVLIPKNKIDENISGQIEVISKCKNYPIFYGEAPDGRQNYVLTYDAYGDVKEYFEINISMNTGKLKIIKMDNDTNKRLQGVEFEFVSENGEYRYKGTTDKDGCIYFNDLFPGRYILKEINGLDEYEICENDFKIEIKYGLLTELEVVNTLKKGKLKIVKIDEENENIKLDGVIFELYDENMKLLETLVTDENGEVESKYYPSENKKYFLKEIKTIEGYVLNDEIIELELKDGETIECIIKNKKVEEPLVEIPEEPSFEIPEETVEEIPEESPAQIPKEPVEEILEELPFEILEEPEVSVKFPKLPKTGF